MSLLLRLSEKESEFLCACPSSVLGREFIQGNTKHVFFKVEGKYAYARINSIILNGTRHEIPEEGVKWFTEYKRPSKKDNQYVYQYLYQPNDGKLIYHKTLSCIKPKVKQIMYENDLRDYPKLSLIHI